MGYLDNLKGIGKKALGAADKFSGATNSVSLHIRKAVEGKKGGDTPSSPKGDGAFPFLGYVFYPGGGVGVKTTFLDDHIEHGGKQIPYSDIVAIEVKHVAANNLTNATAQITLTSGKAPTLAAQTSDVRLFLQAVGYAGDMANRARNGANAYKYGLHGDDGTTIEVYEDYLIFKSITSGLMSKTSKDTLSFAQFERAEATLSGEDVSFVLTAANGEEIAVTMPSYCAQKARDAAEHIMGKKREQAQSAEEHADIPPTAWQPLSGSDRTFALNGETLHVPASLDLFNSYRLQFRALANEYADLARKDYDRKVHDLDTFIMFFPDIYGPYLERLLQGGVDILIAEGIWTETLDSLRTAHLANYHLALDDYQAMRTSLNLTDEQNHQNVETAAGFVPTLSGGGFGFKGAMKGIAKAEAFNLVAGAAVGALHNITQVTPAQKAELFGRIKPDALFDRVFFDYWNTHLTLVSSLAANGRQIWLPDAASAAQAERIAQNLSNPNFPKEQVTAVMLQILLACPYKKEYQQLLQSKFGDTDEVKAIHDYFGFTDFHSVRVTG